MLPESEQRTPAFVTISRRPSRLTWKQRDIAPREWNAFLERQHGLVKCAEAIGRAADGSQIVVRCENMAAAQPDGEADPFFFVLHEGTIRVIIPDTTYLGACRKIADYFKASLEFEKRPGDRELTFLESFPEGTVSNISAVEPGVEFG